MTQIGKIVEDAERSLGYKYCHVLLSHVLSQTIKSIFYKYNIYFKLFYIQTIMKSETFLPQQHSQTPMHPYPQQQGDRYTHEYAYLPPPPPYTEQAYNTAQNFSEAPAPVVEEVSKEDIQNEENFVESTLQWIPRQPSHTGVRGSYLEVNCPWCGFTAYPANLVPAQKPVIIPRVDVASRLKAPLPFLRAYSPELRAHGINETDFLAFIDNLAVAQAGSPVFQAVNVAGMGIGFVPYHWAQAAGAGIQVAAGVGTAAVAAIRTKKFMARSNEEYFVPRGLKVSIKKDEEVASIVGAPSNQRMLVPVNIGPNSIISMRDRRMAALAPYIASLTTDVPPPTKQRNILDKIAAKQVDKTTEKKEKGLHKKQRKAQHKQESIERLRGNGYNIQDEHHEVYIDDGSSSDSDSSMDSVESKIAKLDGEIRKINRKADAELLEKGPSKAAKIESERSKELAKVEWEKTKRERKINKKLGKAQEKGQKRDSKIEKKVVRMEYIVIESLV